MDEMILNGKTHVSSKRAAEITGYAKDYIGQLCREGRIEARLVGRSWYVDEESLRRHRFGGDVEAPVASEEVHNEESSPIEENNAPEELPVDPVEQKIIEAIEEGEKPVPPAEEETQVPWEPIKYTPEEFSMLPEIEKVENTSDIGAEEMINEATENTHEEVTKEEVPTATPVPIKTQQPIVRKAALHDIRPAKQKVVMEETPVRSKKATKTVKGATGGYNLISAALIAISIFSIVFTLIVTGIYEYTEGPFAGIFQYLGGTSVIK